MTLSHDSAPLVVDLDGTLVNSDLLIESTFVLAHNQPLALLCLPAWLRQGKARLKHEIANRASLDIANLPYNLELLDHLIQEKQAGRRLILATASNQRYAQQVADHLQLFDDVLASNTDTNLTGNTKLVAIRQLLGDNTPFDYAADHDDDRLIWAAARECILVNATQKTSRWASNTTTVRGRFKRQPVSLSTWFKALRVYQWSKNLLIFIPLLAGHQLIKGDALWAAVLAFIAYGVLASSVYLLNDLADLANDRCHPNKRHRPFASGILPLYQGVLAIPLLLLTALAISLLLPPPFIAVLGIYYITTLAYSFGLKQIVLVDVLILAGLYTLRLLAGGAATGIPLSFWLLAFSTILFLSLAMAKRCAELRLIQGGASDGAGRGYKANDLQAIESMGTAAGYASVVILALYINSPAITRYYSHPELFWLLCPVILYWISHIWLQTMRGRMTDDPIVFATRDNSSRVSIALGVIIVLVASL